MNENKHIPFDPENFQYEPTNGGAQEVRDLINKGKYQQAESLLKSTDLEAEEREVLNKELNRSLREAAPGLPKNGDISFEQAEPAIKAAEDEEYKKYLIKNQPRMMEFEEMNGIVTENEGTLDELSNVVQAAEKQAAEYTGSVRQFFKIPIISRFRAAAKGEELKKTLGRLEELNAELKNPALLDSALDADRISPDSNKLEIAGNATFIGGLGATLTGTLFPPIGTIAMAAGLVTSVIGNMKSLADCENMDIARRKLALIKEKIRSARENNEAAKAQIHTGQDASIQGARENTEKLMARAA